VSGQTVYTYAGNDSLDRTDPAGLEAACIVVNNCDLKIPQVSETTAKVIIVGTLAVGAVVTAGVIAGVATGASAATAAAATDAGSTAVAAATGAGQAATAAGTVTTSGAAAAGIVAADGTVATGLSTGAGGAGITNATVQAAADAIPGGIRTGITGLCAECNAMSNLANMGAKLEGATMATVRIVSEKIMQACPSCKFIAEKLGVNIVPKP
jgi:hypothetical protein